MIEGIELYKRWDEYTEEERALLPPLTDEEKEEITDDFVPYIWTGEFWALLWRD